MAQTVPPPPFSSTPTNSNGFFSEAWVKWFTTLYLRAGGKIALTNIELEGQQAADLADVEADISALETLTTTHTSEIAAINDELDELRQGPNL